MVPAGESVPPMSTGLVVVALGLGIFSAIMGHHELGAAQRIANPRDGDLYR